ncbi:8926_t:CDS:2 [Funneliformis mosseae]|uniref:8926_t:CDS:1 n=1 Tax=Funneliformis mosseae TaxID=27381 RepID=A0A9N9HFZ0_FUNMO|nr:8926_t:CDS:2 [Funneliformis mosseae]
MHLYSDEDLIDIMEEDIEDIDDKEMDTYDEIIEDSRLEKNLVEK